MRRLLLIKLIGLLAINSYSQTADSIVRLNEVIVNAYPSKPALLHSTGSAAIISEEQIKDHNSGTLLSVMNSQAGVRMEERSPGSYRLSIRGSLLRSPFGIRNIKIYYDEFPLTDAGGNSYLNLIEPLSIRNVEILKGPEGSIFGANTGGVILLNSITEDSSKSSMAFSAASYGFVSGYFSVRKKMKNYLIELNNGSMRADGYRRNSAMNRNSLQLLQKYSYKKGDVKTILIYSDLNYQTPGALTLQQYQADPVSARPATLKLPGAEEQKAGVYNRTTYGGLSNRLMLRKSLTHVITIFGSYTDFKNPFITNFEKRFENNLGARTYFTLKKDLDYFRLNFSIGYEASKNNINILNYNNDHGTTGELQSHDHLSATQQILFSQLILLFSSKLQLELSGSINKYSYGVQSVAEIPNDNATQIALKPQLMPKAGLSYRIINNLVWRIAVSKGYSPPTLAEIRPSDNQFYSGLQPESGFNYETGLRYKTLNERLNLELAIFSFQLKDAIIRRTSDSGAEYFINSGGTQQNGIEFQSAIILKKLSESQFIRECVWRTGITYNKFSFGAYINNTNDYSGNKLTGVPEYTATTDLKLNLPFKTYFFTVFTRTSKIPLSDDNLNYSNEYNLLQIKVGKVFDSRKKAKFEIYATADNILDEKYSLGNDLNAAAGRYFNPAPPCNYRGGIIIQL